MAGAGLPVPRGGLPGGKYSGPTQRLPAPRPTRACALAAVVSRRLRRCVRDVARPSCGSRLTAGSAGTGFLDAAGLQVIHPGGRWLQAYSVALPAASPEPAVCRFVLLACRRRSPLQRKSAPTGQINDGFPPGAGVDSPPSAYGIEPPDAVGRPLWRRLSRSRTWLCGRYGVSTLPRAASAAGSTWRQWIWVGSSVWTAARRA